MSEASNVNLEHTPDANEWLTPSYRYKDTILQFRTLQLMGYPVELRELDSGDIPDDVFASDQTFQYWREIYPRWVRPVILDPKFEDWVELPDSPGDRIEADEPLDDLLLGHPVQIVSDVDSGEAGTFRYYLEEFESKGSIPHIQPHDSNILTVELLQRCLVAAFERYEEIHSNGGDAPIYIPHIDDNTAHVHGRLVWEGVEPVTPEELMSLYHDYYSLVERLRPEILAFKSQQFTLGENQ